MYITLTECFVAILFFFYLKDGRTITAVDEHGAGTYRVSLEPHTAAPSAATDAVEGAIGPMTAPSVNSPTTDH